MAVLYVEEGPFFGELANVWRLFVPDRTVDRAGSVPEQVELGMAVREEQNGTAVAELYKDGRLIGHVSDNTQFLELRRKEADVRRGRLHRQKRALYRLLSGYFGQNSPWGGLTGIRPTKLFRELQDRHGLAAAQTEFKDKYLVSPGRTELAQQIVSVQRPYIDSEDSIVVYVGIPFCPSRCRYCSFIAQDASSAREARGGYLPALLRELQLGATLVQGRNLRSLYIGGGTPTVLEEQELDTLLSALRDLFPGSFEFTVEAGRPDTITDGRLRILDKHGVTRLCVNPQTTSDETLQCIGRRHRADDFTHAMELAAGRFRSINCDVIAGLPGEDEQTVSKTIRDILAFAPQNVTVHALSVKNAAAFAEDRYGLLPTAEAASAMAERARELLVGAGYRPYYLYRQKYMSGNLENIGYALPGFESVYNIANMEETASVLAFGAGAISKRVDLAGGRVDRAANVKDPMQYILRTDEMAARKQTLFEGAACSIIGA